MLSKIKSSALLPILNGLVGDKLAETGSAWAIQMSFRHKGEDIAVPKMDKKLKGKPVIIFVHGLMADEKIWKEVSIVVTKHAQCIHIRYNTGLHISENGVLLASLLEDYYKKFSPKEINLAGHSMGGLVIRSACYMAQKKRLSWCRTVRKIFLLAVPNEGAGLEKLSHTTSFLLRKIAKFQLGLIGNILDQRSNGIKDLRLGAMLEEDWKDSSPAMTTPSHRVTVPGLPGVIYHIIVGNLLKSDSSSMAKYFGDGLVSQESAISKTLMHVSEVKVFTGTGHNSLMKSKEVSKYIVEILNRL